MSTPTRRTPSADAPEPVRHATVRFGAGPEWSAPQLAATATSSLGVAAYLWCLYLASGGFDGLWWALALVPVVTMSRAGSGVALFLWALLLYGWVNLLPGGAFTWWSLPAAGAMLVSHCATALSAAAPPAGSFTAASLRRWARQALVAFSAAVVVAAGAGALSGRDVAPSPAVYALGLGGLAVGLWLVRTSPPAARD